MKWLLYFRETLILPYDSSTVKNRLLKQVNSIKNVDRSRSATLLAVDPFKFNGFFKNNEFRIFLSVQAPQNFMPMVVGRIEPTSMGSLVFIRYRLFFSTRMFLVFWMSISLFFTVYFFTIYHHPFLALISFALGCFNYAIAYFSFIMHLKKVREEVHVAIGAND